jgi:DNA-binding NtrC family response regulator
MAQKMGRVTDTSKDGWATVVTERKDAYDYLTKPFDFDTLRSTVEKAVAQI